jgi:prepilin peptidase CpaA
MFHVLPEQVIIVCYLGLLAWAACSDAVDFEIPNTASLGLALLYPLFVLVSPVRVEWLWAVMVAGAIFVAGLLLFASGRFGGGDVKLLSASALWAGPKLILPMLIVMSLAGGVLALLIWGVQRLRRYHFAASGEALLTPGQYAVSARLPYGIAIAAGAGLVGLRLVSG